MGFLDFVLGRRPPSPRKSYTIYCARNAPAPERRRRPKTRSAQRQAKARRPRSLGAPTHPESLPGRGDEHAAGDAYPPPDYASTPPGGGASGSAVPPPDAPSPAKDEAILAWREQAHEASRRVGAKPAASTVPVPGGGKTRGVLTVPTVPGPNASRAVRGYDLYARNPDDVGAQGYCYPRAQCARSPRRSRYGLLFVGPFSCVVTAVETGEVRYC